MELLNYIFPLTGPEVTAPVPWSLKWEHGLQVSGAPANPLRIVLLGEAKPPAVMTVGKEAKAHSDPPLATVGNNFALAFTHLREDSQKFQNKRPNTSPEQSPQQTKERDQLNLVTAQTRRSQRRQRCLRSLAQENLGLHAMNNTWQKEVENWR